MSNDTKEILPILRSQLPYPSLNEVNFVAFGETTSEYHNELYGYLESEGKLSDFKAGKPTRIYHRLRRDGSSLEEHKILSENIRHQIHHPENSLNTPYTEIELMESIQMMRDFIMTQ